MNSQDQPETFDSNTLEMSISQRFELEKMNRAIDDCNSLEELKSLAKSLTSAWMTQKSAIAWMIRENLSKAPTIKVELPNQI